MLSSQSRLFVIDGSLSSRVGFMRELFQQMGGMGENSSSTAHILYQVNLLDSSQLPPRARIGGVVSTSWANDAFLDLLACFMGIIERRDHNS